MCLGIPGEIVKLRSQEGGLRAIGDRGGDILSGREGLGAEGVLAAMRRHPLRREAARIGRVVTLMLSEAGQWRRKIQHVLRGWAWGAIGAVLAVPLTVSGMLLCARVPSLGAGRDAAR